MRGLNKKSPPLILIVLLCVILSVTQVSAGVNDNVVTAKLESEVGTYEDSKEAHTVFGLLHYLVYQIDQLRTDLANVQVAVSQIQLSSSVSNAMTEQTLYSQFVSSGKTRIEDWSSNVNLQEALATSSIMINSENSNYALDWYVRNKTDISDYLSKLDGYNYTTNYMTITDFANSKQAIRGMSTVTFYDSVKKSTEYQKALNASSLIVSTTVWSATSPSLGYNIMLQSHSYAQEHTSWHEDCTGASAAEVTLHFNGKSTKLYTCPYMLYYSMSDLDSKPFMFNTSISFGNGGCSYGTKGCSNVMFKYIPLD